MFHDRKDIFKVSAECDDGQRDIASDYVGVSKEYTCSEEMSTHDLPAIIHEEIIPPYYVRASRIGVAHVPTVFRPFWANFRLQSRVIRVEHGDISGTTYQLPSGRTVHAFYGVPYAAPPTHKFRFREPQSVKPWTGTWNASTVSSPCLQYVHTTYSIVGEEDCLYVNIFTPKLPQNGVSPLLDVLVYIHGGAFSFGSGNSIFPDYLMMYNDVVCVTVNYRLGSLGFLSTGDDVVPGNNGLKDQSAALKWVHHNIIRFGGNPASVTIAGSSAGGASVHYHYLSTLSEGFFQKGISFSGSVLPPWTLSRNNTEKSIHLAALVGCPTTTTRDAVKCLRRRPGRQIVKMVEFFQPWRYSPFTPFGPVVEPVAPNAFLSEEPVQLLTKRLVKDLPWLISFNTDEGLYPASEFIGRDECIQQLESGWLDIAPHLFAYNFSVSSDAERNAVSQAIKKYYFNNEPVSKNTIPNLVKALGDRLFFADIIRAAKLHSSATKENVFCFMFNYRGKYSLTNKYAQNMENYGISHADDITYIFNYLGSSALETKSDADMVEYITSVVGTFMKNGNPNSGNPQWEPLSKNVDDKFSCLFMNSSDAQSMEELSKVEEIEFWKNVLPSEYFIPINPTLKDEL
ncbi:hypothetical protein V9T40_007624 [Parthenolecanium corni]|uniref:Carboxylic ester hydrolase n=1 Tax=Parthenolecanium corni TaxID=536013 RepID=A0AAN9Y4V0_9HEMI